VILFIEISPRIDLSKATSTVIDIRKKKLRGGETNTKKPQQKPTPINVLGKSRPVE